jgi:hypothetical protein
VLGRLVPQIFLEPGTIESEGMSLSKNAISVVQFRGLLDKPGVIAWWLGIEIPRSRT